MLSAVSTIAKELKAQGALKANSDSAKKVGALAAQAAISVGLKKVVFDRRGAKFHGKVKALAARRAKAGWNSELSHFDMSDPQQPSSPAGKPADQRQGPGQAPGAGPVDALSGRAALVRPRPMPRTAMETNFRRR